MWMYKGFDENMQCRGFQFHEGETYEEEYAELCQSGFHACEYPLDVFSYYHPNDSIYHEVELDGVTDRDPANTKRAGKKITVGEKKHPFNMLRDSIKWLKANKPDNVNRDYIVMGSAFNRKRQSCAYTSAESSMAGVAGANSIAQVIEPYSIAAATGISSGALAEHRNSVAVTIGSDSAAVTREELSTALATDDTSAAIVRARKSTAITTGIESKAVAEAVESVAIAAGDYSRAEAVSYDGVAIALGKESVARGTIGNWLVLTERINLGFKNVIKDMRCVQVDGKNILPDVWYKLEDGEIKMVKEEV